MSVLTFPHYQPPAAQAALLQQLFLTQKPIWCIPTPLLNNWLSTLAGDGRVLTLVEGTLPLNFDDGWLRDGDLFQLCEEPLLPTSRPHGKLDDLLTDLSKHQDYRCLLFLHAHPESGAQLEIEGTIERLNQEGLNPSYVADVSLTLGRIPFYLDAWGLDAAFACANGYAICASEIPTGLGLAQVPTLPAGLEASIAMILAHAGEDWWQHPSDASLANRWNQIHLQASEERQWQRESNVLPLTEFPVSDLTLWMRTQEESLLDEAAKLGDVFAMAEPSMLDLHIVWIGQD
jgi:hypothetical protein